MLSHSLKNSLFFFATVSLMIQTFIYPNNSDSDQTIQKDFWENHNNN